MKLQFKYIYFLTLLLVGSFFAFNTAKAQQDQGQTTTMKAIVTDVTSQQNETVPGTTIKDNYQTLQAKILDGAEAGKIVDNIEDDYVTLNVGDVFYLTHTIDSVAKIDSYTFSDPYRLPWLYGLIGLFVICVLIFGGKQGSRGLIALALSFIFIAYLLFPGILHGFSPILMSIGVASLMIILGSYITHGFNKVTTSAVIGMVVTIIFTGVLAYISIHGAKLTGFGNEEATYLNADTNGTIDFSGLLLGGIIIGLLGVLYDAAIGQAVAVDELHGIGPHLSRRIIFH